ncbi:MAG: FAD-binding oxidoreductase [Anaerolineae bacterium]|nr:FAD-binding oxidoreductase [Anaerolineae bacterium]
MVQFRTTTTVVPVQINTPIMRLRSSVEGSVLVPANKGYDEARRAWNLTVDQRPAVIVVAKNALDVMESVRFARESKLDICVQATGHGNLRPANGSLLIVTANMQGVHIDPLEKTAWVEAGVKWQAVLEKAHPMGLTPLLGSSSDVGAVGYTLGGGMGWLARKYGLSADSVEYFQVVTPAGELVIASRADHPDLFWALRGGGGGFGIVVGMQIKLYAVSNVYAGNLYYPIERAKEVFQHYRDWITYAPDELTSSIAIMNYPDLPGLPDFLRGQTFAMVRGCFTGSQARGEALLQFWREWHPPLLDDFKWMPFSQSDTISSDPVDPSPTKTTGAWLNDLSDETLDLLIAYAVPRSGVPTPLFTEVRHAGGAIAKVSAYASAFTHRTTPFSMQLVGLVGSKEEKEAFLAYTDQLKHELGAHLSGGVYLNFLSGDEARQRTSDGYTREAFQRLKAIKAKYDPDNMFSHSYQIPPVATNTVRSPFSQ